MANSPAKAVWWSMVDRCTNPNNKRWSSYGGRDITLSDEWASSFVAWHTHVSTLPNYPYDERGRRVLAGYSLDRIDNDGPYTKGNVRWATPTEQANNRTRRYVMQTSGQVALAIT
jgi:hypothetical protein